MPAIPQIDHAADPAVSARRRRIVALSAEIGREMGLEPALLATLAAPEELLSPDDRLPAVIEIAGRVDAALAGAGNDERSFPALLADCWSAEEGGVGYECLTALERLYERYSPLVYKTPPKLGVCPAVMAKALELFSREDVTLAEVEGVAGCDPVLVTSLLRYANSAMYDRGTPARTIKAAIARIGFTAARSVIVAASARPLFDSTALNALWRHSVDVASIAQQIAGLTEKADPSEAFVAGLTHDLGLLAIEMIDDAGFLEIRHRLTDASGCPILADFVLNGQDHGQIGASILSIWKMPDSLIEAIRHHHRPELGHSPMPSILYLAERVALSAEDIEVPSRLRGALDCVGMASIEDIAGDAGRLSTALSTIG
ncbi:MAG: HDOD domain-containing protein [Acidobacteria bacterium]|nr:HDOD domain-containing protein [Acidobacteriota bacterium]